MFGKNQESALSGRNVVCSLLGQWSVWAVRNKLDFLHQRNDAGRHL
jgi:hypothetical protein